MKILCGVLLIVRGMLVSRLMFVILFVRSLIVFVLLCVISMKDVVGFVVSLVSCERVIDVFCVVFWFGVMKRLFWRWFGFVGM